MSAGIERAADQLGHLGDLAEQSTLSLLKDVNMDETGKQVRSWLKTLLFAVVVLLLYVGLAMIWLVWEGPDWTNTDAVYFAAMTASTVGYGDISPTTPPSRAFTILMAFIGIGIVFPAVGSAFSGLIFEPITTRSRALLERLFPQHAVHLGEVDETNAADQADYTVPRHPLIYYPKQLLPSLTLNLLLQLASAGIFCLIEDWDYGSALYHCLITATTIGYGDQTILTEWGKRFASLHMLIAVSLLAELLGSIDQARISRRDHLARVAQLSRELDRPLVTRLMQAAINLRPMVERDGKGVTELEFAIGMLIELGAVDEGLVKPFIKQFRKLDLTDDGRLGMEDLLKQESLTVEETRVLRRQLTKKHQSGKIPLVSLSAAGSGSTLASPTLSRGASSAKVAPA